MPNAIDGLKPAGLWKYFAELSAIPRPSKHEAQAAAFVVATAKKLGLECAQDPAGTVVVRKPASKGYEGRPMVCLQGHLDMVPEKRPDKKHDFLKDPITLVRKGNTMMADGTTLGADNGVAVATSLAIMADASLAHGPLEFLFTIDEETGLTGAHNLQPGFLKSTILLNLDSEEEGALYVGCSGGRDTMGTWALDTEAAPAGTAGLEIKVGGLRGGHSGLEIDKGRGNAIKLLTRVLLQLAPLGARLARIDGGNKRNAIPRDAVALVFVPKKKLDEARAIVAAMHATCRAELSASVDPTPDITAAPAKGRGKVLKKGLQKKLLLALAGLPHGVIKMSADIPGLVETSTNLGVITTGKKDIAVSTSQRSSVASENRRDCAGRAGDLRAWRRQRHRLGRLSGLEAEPRLAHPQDRDRDLHAALRQGARGEGRARRPGVRHHRREVPRHGHGVVRADARGRAFARREDLHRHGREGTGTSCWRC